MQNRFWRGDAKIVAAISGFMDMHSGGCAQSEWDATDIPKIKSDWLLDACIAKMCVPHPTNFQLVSKVPNQKILILGRLQCFEVKAAET